MFWHWLGKVLWITFGSVLIIGSALSAANKKEDPLPSWRENSNKQAILKFVADVTSEGSPTFVKPEDRIATFNNDGTLCSEVPIAEMEFAKLRLQEILRRNRTLRRTEPYKSLLEKENAVVPFLTQKEALEIMSKTTTGMTEDEFAAEVRAFLNQARHPKLHLPYTQSTYQPMLELMAYLRQNNFKIFLSSGGDLSFLQVIAPDMYQVPAENIIGSFFTNKMVEKNGKLSIVRTPQLGMMNDKENKPIGILRRIGKRPIFSAGNVRSGGDVEHLRYSSEGPGTTLQLMINHDDAEREAAYVEKDGRSLAAAKILGWKIVSIKNDWQEVFAKQSSMANSDINQQPTSATK